MRSSFISSFPNRKAPRSENGSDKRACNYGKTGGDERQEGDASDQNTDQRGKRHAYADGAGFCCGRQYDGDEHRVQHDSHCVFQAFGQYIPGGCAEKGAQYPADQGKKHKPVKIQGGNFSFVGYGDGEDFIRHGEGRNHSRGRCEGSVQLLRQSDAHKRVTDVDDEFGKDEFNKKTVLQNQIEPRQLSGACNVCKRDYGSRPCGKAARARQYTKAEGYRKIPERDRNAVGQAFDKSA